MADISQTPGLKNQKWPRTPPHVHPSRSIPFHISLFKRLVLLLVEYRKVTLDK
jgi:hypothetical protein